MELKDRFTEVGYIDLKNRLKTLVSLFNSNDKWNEELLVLGFGKLLIEDREECFGRIKELSQILGVQINLIKVSNGEDTVDYQIEVGL